MFTIFCSGKTAKLAAGIAGRALRSVGFWSRVKIQSYSCSKGAFGYFLAFAPGYYGLL
jgi:hypothetical protein